MVMFFVSVALHDAQILPFLCFGVIAYKLVSVFSSPAEVVVVVAVIIIVAVVVVVVVMLVVVSGVRKPP